MIGMGATLSPARKPAAPARTTPDTSQPGTNGTSGRRWYSPRVCSTSGKVTPAYSTSTSTWCDDVGAGSGRSWISTAPGPLSAVITAARMTHASGIERWPTSSTPVVRRRRGPARRAGQLDVQPPDEPDEAQAAAMLVASGCPVVATAHRGRALRRSTARRPAPAAYVGSHRVEAARTDLAEVGDLDRLLAQGFHGCRRCAATGSSSGTTP